MSNNNGFYGNSTFGLTAVNTSSTYRNLTKIGSDTYPSHDDAKGSQNSQPHYYQPQNKLDNALYTGKTYTGFFIPETATTPETAFTPTFDEWTRSGYVTISAPSGASGPTTYYFNTQYDADEDFSMYTSFRKYNSIDKFHQSGGGSSDPYLYCYAFSVLVKVQPFSRICVFSGFDADGNMRLPVVFYNRWESLLTADLIPPADIEADQLPDCVDLWQFNWVFANFGTNSAGEDEDFITLYDETFRGKQAWIYLPYAAYNTEEQLTPA